ncbi:hypothetical protein SAMN05446635_9471 [Burkholderia sp. OK233]|nr:hypothetical protein SAMN05446635_9471 [Burkholderia sp. OK233]
MVKTVRTGHTARGAGMTNLLPVFVGTEACAFDDARFVIGTGETGRYMSIWADRKKVRGVPGHTEL